MYKILMFACVTATAVFGQETAPDKRLQQAASVVNDMLGQAQQGMSRSTFDRARCIVIIPSLKKAAIGVGAEFGRGFASCRQGTDGWGPPAAVKLEGGSVGPQIGGQSTDVVLLVMNQKGMDRLLADKFALGVDASIAAGPGRDAQADTDLSLRADILSYSRSHGVFAGLSLKGATLHQDSAENKKLYGRAISNKEILEKGVPTPEAATVFTSALNHASGKEQADRPSK
jgi:lipid-binding SYLF domain-containing protein